jgi:hypothetical protein
MTMAFGKRSAGEGPAGRPPATSDFAEAHVAPIGAVRTRVANHGEIDRTFIAIAAGVVVLSAGAAIAAPSLMGVFTGGIRPIEQVIAGLDRAGVERVLADEAFPDPSGKAFMASLATSFPSEHKRLIGRLADTASAGGDRDDLFTALNAWSMEFTMAQLPAIGRTGAEGFDRTLSILTDGLRVVEARAGGCNASTLQRMFMDERALSDLTSYGTDGYRVGMRAGHTLVELAALGRDADPIDARLTADDMNALRSTFISFMMDDQVMSLIQATSMSGNADLMSSEVADKLNICQLGRAIAIKLDNLPTGTKARLWATATTGNPNALLGGSGFSSFNSFNGATLQPGLR